MNKKETNTHIGNQSRNTDYDIYTDGGCDVNPGGKGGYGVVIHDNKHKTRKEYLGSFYPTTNNRMEMMAVIIALEHIPDKTTTNLHSDSRYVINTLTKGWEKNKNTDLWARLAKAEQHKHINYIWVKGHNGNPDNERCDQLATQAIQSIAPQKDEGFSQAPAQTDKQNKKPEASDKKEQISSMAVRIEVPSALENECRVSASPSKMAAMLEITEECAEHLLSFWSKEKPSFADYKSLKTGGTDKYSSLKKKELIEALGQPSWDEAEKYLEQEIHVCSALRWHMRGLSLSDAIRKELVSMEIAQNIRK